MGKKLASAIEVAMREAQGRRLRAVDYLRVSTDEQIKGYGIQHNSRKTKRHIEKKGWEHVDTFKDEGVSGSLEAHEREDLPRLMKLARQTPRPFDVVVVSEGRAIGRAGRAFWPWVWELEDLGVFVAVVKGDYDNTTPDGRSRMRKAADAAEDEREQIRDRTQGGIQEKAEDGLHPGGHARYGYYIENQGKVGVSRLRLDECDNRERCTRTDPCTAVHETAVLRRGRELMVKNRGNWYQTVLTLNTEGLVSRSGKPWTAPNFRGRLLGALDPTYVFRGKKDAILDEDGNPVWGESVTINLDRIFTDDEVTEVQSACTDRTRRPVSGGRVYPLSGRINSLCGSHYVGRSSPSSGQSPHYGCAGKDATLPGAPKCTCGQIDADGIDAWAWEQVSGMLGDAERLRQLAQRQVERTSDERIDHASRLAELDQHVAEQEDAITVAMTMAAKQATRRGLRGKEAEASVARTIRPLEEELDTLEAQRREILASQASASDAARRAGDLDALAQRASEGLQGAGPEDQARLYELLQITGCLTGPVPPMRRGLACSVAEWFTEQKRLVPELTDASWSEVSGFFKRGLEDRKVLEAILRKAGSGARWSELEREYGTTALRTYWRRWMASGLWENVMLALPKEGQPVPRRHPLPPIHLHGVLHPGLILAASESREGASGPWGQFSDAAYRFSVAVAA